MIQQFQQIYEIQQQRDIEQQRKQQQTNQLTKQTSNTLIEYKEYYYYIPSVLIELLKLLIGGFSKSNSNIHMSAF
jgi:hypothetical protein